MERYSEYKDSGVQWLGMIPNHWEFCRFKNIASLITIPSKSSHKIGLENIESGTGKYLFSESEFEGNGIQFEIGDIVYGKLRPYLQKVWKATFSGNAVGDFFVFRPNYKIDRNYLLYLMLSKGFTDDVNSSTYGAKMPRVSSDYIMTMRCGIPPFSEQQSIAAYLDAIIGKIDKAIAQQQKMIDLLNERKQIIINHAATKGLNPDVSMKDSGVEWMGQIPEHWEICKLKYLFRRIADGTHFSPSTVEEGYPYITASDVRGIGIDYANAKKISIDDYKKLVAAGCRALNGDILLVKDGATTGRVGLKIDDVECVTLSSVAMLTPKETQNTYYLMYMMMSDAMQKQILLSMAGAAMPRITLIKLNNFLAVKPPIDEQIKIVKYVKSKIDPLNWSIRLSEQQIVLLQERKQIIINEVVTGKVRVS